MLYPARWKKITIDQSKVLKNRLLHFLGATQAPKKTKVTKLYSFVKMLKIIVYALTCPIKFKDN